jgi:hypothetical protein
MCGFDMLAEVEIRKMDIEAAERKATENARFRHLKSKEREMLDAALARVCGFLRVAFDSVRAKLTTGPINKELSY